MNRASLYFICWLILFATNHPLCAQNLGSHPLALTPETNPGLETNEGDFRKRMKERYEPRFTNAAELEEFIGFTLSARKEYFNSNYIYTNFQEATKYLEGILSKIIPARLRTSGIRVYLVRDPSFNASVMADGSVFINIGLLATIRSEAELAAVLGHEFGHYEAGHGYQRFRAIKSMAQRDDPKKSGLSVIVGSYRNMKQLSGQSVSNETESDNFAIKLMRENGFSPVALNNNFDMMRRLDEKYESLKGRRGSSFYFKSHPSNKARIKNTKKQFTKAEIKKGARFFYDSAMFCSLRQRAIDESINLHYENKDYTECIEEAFRQHLFFPEDEFYIFYIAESLRRYTVLYPDEAGTYFFVGRYNMPPADEDADETRPKEIVSDNIYARRTEYKRSVFYFIDDFVLSGNKEDKKLVKNIRMRNRDTLEFITNEDALAYFRKLAAKLGAAGKAVFNDVFPGDVLSIEANYAPLEKKFMLQAWAASHLKKDTQTLSENFHCLGAIYSVNASVKEWLDFATEEKLKSGYKSYFTADSLFGNNVALNFREEAEFRALSGVMIGKLPFNRISAYNDSVKANLAAVENELARMAVSHKIKNLFFTCILKGYSMEEVLSGDRDNSVKCHTGVYRYNFESKTLECQAFIRHLKTEEDYTAFFAEIKRLYKKMLR